MTAPIQTPVQPPTQNSTPTQPLQLWFDGQIMNHVEAQAPLTTHALHYGSGVFEGIRSYATEDGAAVFRLDEHLKRMQKGAQVLGADLEVEQVRQAVLETLRANQQRDAYVRPLMWFGTGGLGLDVEPLEQHLMVATLPWTSHLSAGRQRLTVSPFQRNPAHSLPPLKLCGAYVNSLLAKHEASQRGFDEAMFVDSAGLVVECTAENVFMVKDGQVTAVAHPDALPGITRATLIELTGAASKPVQLEELLEADEVFVVGTSAEVTSVAAIDNREFPKSSFTHDLQALYQRVVRGQEAQYQHWLTQV